jgi:hypothetical protein
VLRLALWHALERGSATMPETVVAAHREKVAIVAAAQRAGRVSDRFPAGELMVLIFGLAVLGSPDLAPTHTSGPEGLAARRRTVVETVRLLTTKDDT